MEGLVTWLAPLTHFALVTLAVYRLSVMVSLEHGPFSLFERARKAFPEHPEWGKLLRCPFCLSVWFGMVGALLTAATVYEWALHALALSALATILVKKWG
jgi:hypothetical protein